MRAGSPIFQSKLFQQLIFLAIALISLASCEKENLKTKSAYLSRVFEYTYAPGQHAALALPADTSYLIGNPANNNGWLYLGGFGGFVIAGFDHDISNVDGDDFCVYPLKGASPEPAIVYVMEDTNGDGLPNENWYELKGNLFDSSIRNYKLTYYKALNDSANIRWHDSEGKSGELVPGYGAKYSAKWWWPSLKSDSLQFSGTRLPDEYKNRGTEADPFWSVTTDVFQWGYAENQFGTDYDETLQANLLDISNAVDVNGNAITLKSIRFIKLQTGLFQIAGWTNEISSEIKGAADLSMLKK